MSDEVCYARQRSIFDPTKQKSKVFVIGVGSVGSFVTLNLAKLGFNNISVFDFDKVEKENIPNQFYRLSDVGKFKVDALQEVVKDYTGVVIDIFKDKIDEKFEFDWTFNNVVVLCLDNMETRKVVADLFEGVPGMMVDTRMGGDEYQIYAYNMMEADDVKKCKRDMEQAVAETVCGAKSVIYTVLSIASETCNMVKQIDRGEAGFSIIKRNMNSLVILGK